MLRGVDGSLSRVVDGGLGLMGGMYSHLFLISTMLRYVSASSNSFTLNPTMLAVLGGCKKLHNSPLRPVIVVFTNVLPNYELMSGDRWKTWTVN